MQTNSVVTSLDHLYQTCPWWKSHPVWVSVLRVHLTASQVPHTDQFLA